MRKYFLFIILSACLSACMTEKKARRTVATLKSEYPHVLASFCDVKEKETNTIQYIKGERDTLWQAEYVDCDTVIGTDRIVKVPYPVYVPSVDSVIINNTKVVENKEQLNAVIAKLTDTTYKLYNTQNSLKKSRGLNAVLIIILATITLFLYIKSRLKWTK